MSPSSPELSIVLLTPDTCATIRRTLQHLRAQTVKDRLELVIVAPKAASLDLDETLGQDFSWIQVVEVGSMRSTAKARVAGVQAARGPLVAFSEDHSFPAPGWAEAFIRAHRQPWAAVGPVVRNPNPNNLISWTNFLIEYSLWMGAEAGKEADHLPWHNSSYKREILLGYGDRLEALLEMESALHQDLRDRGYRLYQEAQAVTYHLNYPVPELLLPGQFHASRLFAGARARCGGWPVRKRLLYILGAPLIPGVRLWRILRSLRGNSCQPPPLLRLLPLIYLGLLASAAGEALGYLGCEQGALEIHGEMEFHRERFLTPEDWRAVAETCGQ